MIVSSRAETTTARVAALRALMAEAGLDAVLVRSADRYLNEYVPPAESTRIWVTGFTGSMGDALVARDRAWVVVDGRYHLQADDETAGTPFEVEKVQHGAGLRKALWEVARRAVDGGARRLGYEPDRFVPKELEELKKALEGTGAELVPTLPSLVERARGPVDEPARPVRSLPEAAFGATVADKVARLRPALEKAGVTRFVCIKLDELAWLANLRGDDFPYQATFRATGLLGLDRVVLAADRARVPAHALTERGAALEVVARDAWTAALTPGERVGYDPDGTTAAVVDALRAAGCEPVAMPSPIEPARATKNEAELAAMRRAFAKADAVVEAAQGFVHDRLARGERVTEADLADEVERLFLAAGATGLSFKVIAAAGENGAFIHYGPPSAERAIRAGELVLLDTGGYWPEGYATDLTRTFLAGAQAEPSPAQQRMFTLVLKAAIAGMSARLPEGARGDQLDALCRAPLWAHGLDFAHGTGHGVGVNVHEFPPRVSPQANVKLEVGHVFSIEPGLYVAGTGGVRIENLVTVVPAPGHPGFLDIEPLTTSALDERLFDHELLTDAERAWLARYEGLRAARLAGA